MDKDGKRWTFVWFDVMTNNGSKFLRQVKVLLSIHFDFKTGRYCVDKSIGKPLADEVMKQYPSLRSQRNIQLVFTNNKITK